MYLYIKPRLDDGELTPNKDIFTRPTPWAVAWEASFLGLLGRSPYKMVFIPREYVLSEFVIMQQGDHVVLFKSSREVSRFVILDITFSRAFDYDVQSFLYGYFFRFWAWRWNEHGKLTTEELQYKLARLQEQIDRTVQRRSERIAPDDDQM